MPEVKSPLGSELGEGFPALNWVFKHGRLPPGRKEPKSVSDRGEGRREMWRGTVYGGNGKWSPRTRPEGAIRGKALKSW